jgi:uncharacterized protein YkwD
MKTFFHACAAAQSASHYSRALPRIAAVLAFAFAAPNVAAPGEPSFTGQVEARVLVLINDMRIEQGLKPLQRESRLDETAAYFAGYIAAKGVLEHGADGSTPAMRVKERGYSYCVIAENIAYEYSSRGFTPEQLARNFVEGWRNSPTHRANILRSAATESGLGVARNGANAYYAVQLFGLPLIPGAGRAACPR